MSTVHVSEIISESALAGYSNALVPVVLNEPLLGGYSTVRASTALNEPLIGGYSAIRTGLVIVESLFPVPPEYPVVTAILPGFGNSLANNAIPEAADPASGATPGLSFSIHKKPTFNTRVSEAVNFNTVRSRLAPYPRWEFELPYEFLEDRSGAESSLKQMMGFYCARGGKSDPFLMKDPDDYAVTGASLGAAADGTRLQWDLLRWIGAEFSEPVGQVDLTNTTAVYGGVDETLSVPGSGPYTVTVAHAAAFVSDQGVTIGGTALTKVSGAPGAMQYAVSAGVYTFNSAQHGASAVISYTYLIDPSAYTLTLPNKVVFGSAPASGTRLSWDGQFFFTCYFDDDMADFSKFAAKLWDLQTLTFHSELLA